MEVRYGFNVTSQDTKMVFQEMVELINASYLVLIQTIEKCEKGSHHLLKWQMQITALREKKNHKES